MFISKGHLLHFFRPISSSCWRHQMETFSALLVICARNSSVTGEFHAQSQWRGALMLSLTMERLVIWDTIVPIVTSLYRLVQISNVAQMVWTWLYNDLCGDRWIPHSTDQWRGKYFHLMTSSWDAKFLASAAADTVRKRTEKVKSP